MNSNKKFMIMILGVIAVVIFWISWVSSNPADEKAMATFVSVEDLINDNLNQRTKLGGLVKDGSIVISETNHLDCTFILKEGHTELAVKYDRTRPDLFKDGAEVIVTGQYLKGVFYADELQTKCASRYEGDLRNENSYNLTEIDT
ncbi:MAG: cytochrome c maturation protein CcmE [Candidatus Marinimicrobia bacterium]|nr:cytochrome c maturation protein CcmE [Candidatus Neomarinimicrobiota bacterium]